MTTNNDSLFLCNISEHIFIKLDSNPKKIENWFDSFVENGINKRDMDFKVFMREKMEECNNTFAYFKKLTRIFHNTYEAHLEYVGNSAELKRKIKRYWIVYIDNCGHILHIDKLYKSMSYDCVKRYYHEDLSKIDIEFKDSNDYLSYEDEDEDERKDESKNWCSYKEIISALYEVIWR